MQTIIWIVVAIGLLVIVVIMGTYALAFWLAYYASKLRIGLPWMQWLTLEEVEALGYSAFWSRLALPVLEQTKCLEVRPCEGLSLVEQEKVAELQFFVTTIHLYKFRLIKRVRNRRKKTEREKAKLAWRPAFA